MKHERDFLILISMLNIIKYFKHSVGYDDIKLLASRTNLLLLLSGDVSLNSQPFHNNQPQSHSE